MKVSSSLSSLWFYGVLTLALFITLQCCLVDAKSEEHSEMVFFGAREKQTVTIPYRLNSQQLKWDYCHEPVALSVCLRNQDTSGPEDSSISMTINGVTRKLDLYQWSSTMFCGSVSPCDLLSLNRFGCNANTDITFELTTTTSYASGQIYFFAQRADASDLDQPEEVFAPLISIMIPKSKCQNGCDGYRSVDGVASVFGLESIQRLSDGSFTCNVVDPLQATHLIGSTLLPKGNKPHKLEVGGQGWTLSDTILINQGQGQLDVNFDRLGYNMCKDVKALTVCVRNKDFKTLPKVFVQVGEQKKEIFPAPCFLGEKCAVLSICDLGKMLESGCSAVTGMKVLLEDAFDAYGSTAMLEIIYSRLDATTTPTDFSIELNGFSALVAASACPNSSCIVKAGSTTIPMIPMTITDDGKWMCGNSGTPTHYTATFNLRERLSQISVQSGSQQSGSGGNQGTLGEPKKRLQENYSESVFIGGRGTPQQQTVTWTVNTQRLNNFNFCELAALSVCFRNSDVAGPDQSRLSMTVNGVTQQLDLFQYDAGMFCGSLSPCDQMKMVGSSCGTNVDMTFVLQTISSAASGQAYVFVHRQEFTTIHSNENVASPVALMLIPKSLCNGECEGMWSVPSSTGIVALSSIQQLDNGKFTCDNNDPTRATHFYATPRLPRGDAEISIEGQGRPSISMLVYPTGHGEADVDVHKMGWNICEDPRAIALCYRQSDFEAGNQPRLSVSMGSQSKQLLMSQPNGGNVCGLISLCDVTSMTDSACSSSTPIKVVIDDAKPQGASIILSFMKNRFDATKTPTSFSVISTAASVIIPASICPKAVSCSVKTGSTIVPMQPLSIVGHKWTCNSASTAPTHFTASFNMPPGITEASIQRNN